LVTLDLEELPAVYDMRKARDAETALVHEHWGDNVFLESAFEVDIAPAFDAPIKVTREISTARQCMSPLEGRGVVATFDHRLDQLTLYTGAQMPHIVRNGLSDCLGMEQGRIRIVSPDIGGGFGHKGILLPEEVCLAWLTMHKGCAVRWIEDRREHHRQRQLPRAPLQDHRVCGSRRPPPRDRLRSNRRFRRFLVVPLLRLSRGRAGGEHPARSLPDAGLSLPNLFRRDQ
jgi:CO/xanthine dehydrogenase Mo-binding subunit